MSGALAPKRLLAQAPAAAEPETASPRFKPGTGGQILVARNGEAGWRLHADFGPEHDVVSIRRAQDETVAHLRFRGLHDIHLRLSSNGRDWLAS